MVSMGNSATSTLVPAMPPAARAVKKGVVVGGEDGEEESEIVDLVEDATNEAVRCCVSCCRDDIVSCDGLPLSDSGLLCCSSIIVFWKVLQKRSIEEMGTHLPSKTLHGLRCCELRERDD
jgi:hypothetical protein